MTARTLTSWLEHLEQLHPASIDLGLERCGRVYAALGSPRPAATVITVAGTNGKGSAIALMGSLLRQLGHAQASYTSPHLLRFNERLTINGKPVTDGQLIGAFEQVEAQRRGVPLTYFEFTTLACLLLMSGVKPEFALLEVGLGGRLDTVNLVDPDLAVIMPIDVDHQQFLGSDREAIGFEKAGILRRGLPVVLGEEKPPASVLKRAVQLECSVCLPGRDYQFSVSDDAMVFAMGELTLGLPLPPLAGPHQPANLAAALAALNLVCPLSGRHLDALAKGVRRTKLPGRLQSPDQDPRVLLDVGHNPLAAAAVAAHLRDRPDAECHCVLGMLADKDVEGSVAELGSQVGHWYCAGLTGARGQTGQALADRVRSADPDKSAQAFASVAPALEAARAAAGPAATILVFGSFETVAAALNAFSGN